MTQQPDTTLLEAARAGDHAAIVTLYERYRDRIYSFVWYRVGRDDGLAEDISAETFARLIKNLPTLDASQKPLLAWLYTVAGNLVRDQQRRSGKYASDELPDDLISTLLPPEQVAHLSIEMTRSINAMARLNSSQRDALTCRFIDGLSVAETAAVMQIEQGNVKTLTRRGLQRLRKLLEVTYE